MMSWSRRRPPGAEGRMARCAAALLAEYSHPPMPPPFAGLTYNDVTPVT